MSSGRAEVFVGRFGKLFDGSATQTAGIRTRVDIWRGSLAVARHHPYFGVGQDGLIASFNRVRPSGLGSPFDERSPTGYDPLVSSPHSLPLEIFVTLGPLGAAGTVLLVTWLGAAYWRLLRRTPSLTVPFLGAGAVGYLAIAAFNPLSVAGIGQASVLAGAAAGLGASQRRYRLPAAPIGKALARASSMIVLATMAFAALHFVADRQAFEAASAAANGDDETSARHARQAARMVPSESAYRRQDVQATANLGFSRTDDRIIRSAERKLQQFLVDFPGLAPDFLTLARLRIALGEPGVAAALAAAKDASPYGVNTLADIDSLGSRPSAR